MPNHFQITFLFFLVILGTLARPEIKSTSQKIVKINEHEKTKNTLIIQRTNISTDGGHTSDGNDSSGSEEGHSNSKGKDDSKSSESSESDSDERKDDKAPLGSLADVGGHGHGKTVRGSCVNPTPQPAQLYKKFAKTLVSHRVFILSSNHYYADQASLVLTDQPFDIDKAPQACLRVMWEDDRRRLEGYNGNSFVLSCRIESEVTDISCFRKETPDETLRITVVWTNGRSTAVAIMCANGHGFWAILANKREMSRETKEAAMDVLESYGFDPDDVVDYSWTEDDCPSSIPNEHLEGYCVDDLEMIPDLKEASAQHILSRGVYTPLSSYANAYATGMFIRGSPMKPHEDLDNVCVKDFWFDSGEIERQGFGNLDSYLECNMKDFSRISCVPNEDKDDDGAYGYIYNRRIHPVWTDGKKYVLTYNCLSSRYKTWSLYSTSRKPVDAELKKYILAKVADYGFDPLQAYEADYDNCHN